MLLGNNSYSEMVTSRRESHLIEEKTESWEGEQTCLDLGGANASQAASAALKEQRQMQTYRESPTQSR